jgi:hypothetical protein
MCTWASINPGAIKGSEGSGEIPPSVSIECILPSRTSMDAGVMLLEWQSTKLPLILKWFMELKNTKELVCLHRFTAGVENTTFNK